MKKMFLAALISGLLPCLAQAQTSDYSKGYGYVSFAPGGRLAGGFDYDEPTIHIGFGGEGFFTRYLGAGADVAFLHSPEWLDGREPARKFVILSPRLVARLLVRDERNPVEPFVTGGYSLILRQDAPNGVVYGEKPRTWWETDNGMNFGGGFNWWFNRDLGVRFELRDCIWQPFASWGSHVVSVHIGLTFR